jgi:hypothetical protein
VTVHECADVTCENIVFYSAVVQQEREQLSTVPSKVAENTGRILPIRNSSSILVPTSDVAYLQLSGWISNNP